MGAMFFNVDDPAGGQYMLHVVAGPDAAAFAGMRQPRATELFGPIFRGEAPIRLDDVSADPRFGPQPPGHIAADGVQALAIAAEHRPEIAILDIGLPVMDGYELAARLRALLPAPVRLIALTGYGQVEDRSRAPRRRLRRAPGQARG